MTEVAGIRMPFGKHYGVLVSELPDDYLMWLYETANLYGRLADAVDNEFHRRFGDHDEDSDPEDEYSEPDVVLIERLRLDPVTQSVCLKLVEVGYRQLALKNHPDVGGDHRAMQAINRAVEVLRSAIGERSEP